MKIMNLLCRSLPILVLTVALGGWPWILIGDEKPLQAPVATIGSGGAGYDLEIVDGQLIRPGGRVEATLPRVVDALRDGYPDANFILSPALAKLKVADLKLRAGHLADELEAVRVASGGKFEVRGPSGPNPPMDPNTGLPLAGAVNLNAGLFVLRETRSNPETERMVEAFNIGPYLEWLHHRPDGTKEQDEQGVDEIQIMISDTLSAFKGESNGGEQPTFRYHRGANLLVVVGNIDSVEIARKIVSALPGMRSPDGIRTHGLEPLSASERDDLARRYGVASPADAQGKAAAEDAFRKRYGLAPRPLAAPPSPGNIPPESSPPK